VGVANDVRDDGQPCCPVFVRKPQSTSVIEGDKVKLTCQVQGHPKPQVDWLKDGKPVETTPDERVKVKTLSLLPLHLCIVYSVGWNVLTSSYIAGTRRRSDLLQVMGTDYYKSS